MFALAKGEGVNKIPPSPAASALSVPSRPGRSPGNRGAQRVWFASGPIPRLPLLAGAPRPGALAGVCAGGRAALIKGYLLS